MYGSHNILDGVLLVSYFQHWHKKQQQKKKKKQKKQKHFAPFTSCSLFGSIFMIFSYIKKKNKKKKNNNNKKTKQMGSFAFMFSVLLPFLKIKLLEKTVHRQLWSCFIHNQCN